MDVMPTTPEELCAVMEMAQFAPHLPPTLPVAYLPLSAAALRWTIAFPHLAIEPPPTHSTSGKVSEGDIRHRRERCQLQDGSSPLIPHNCTEDVGLFGGL